MNIDADLEQVTSRAAAKVGNFRLYHRDQRWEWSDSVAAMHGYAPGEVEPTTELMLAHKHPDDKTTVAAAIERSVDTGEPFSSTHRIVDTGGVVHSVVVVGDRMIDEVSGDLLGTSGFYIDLTENYNEDVKAAIDARVPELARARAAIEQAKGALMMIYGISAERAFDVLVWHSQESNTKVRTIAEHLVEAMRTDLEIPAGLRTAFDHLLLSWPPKKNGR